jgi:hypothetical protein
LPFTSTFKGESENAVALDRTGITPFVGFILRQACAGFLSFRSSRPGIADCASAILQKTHNKTKNAMFFIVNPLKPNPI